MRRKIFKPEILRIGMALIELPITVRQYDGEQYDVYAGDSILMSEWESRADAIKEANRLITADRVTAPEES